MHDASGAPSASSRPKRRASAHRRLAALAAGIALAGLAAVAAAEDRPASGDLRGSVDIDATAGDRALVQTPLTPPLAADHDAAPAAPFDLDAKDPGTDEASGDDVEGPADGDAPAPRKPRIDLFAEPAGKRSEPSNAAAPSAVPAQAARRSSRSADGTDAKPKRDRRDGEPPTTARTDPSGPRPDDDSASPRIDAAGPLQGGRLSLPAAPVRSSRTETLDDLRLNRPAAPFRGVLPPAVNEPFAPIGLRLGTFILYAALDQSAGYSSNLDQSAREVGGAFSDTTLSTRLVSDWSRHAAELDMLANYRRDFAGENRSDPDVAIDGQVRLDVDRLTTANLRGGFLYRREDASDLDSLDEAEGERPDLLNYSASADLQHEFGDAFARGTVSAVRETKDGDAGGAAPGEDFDTYTGALRAGYRISTAFAPFAEGSVGRRIFDEGSDALGEPRDSTISSLRGGLSFDFGEKLTGEVAAGYAWNAPEADDVGTTASPTVDAKIAWSPRRGTDVALTAATTFDPDTASLTTATLYQAGLAVRHRATARLDLDAAFTAGYRDSQLAGDSQRTWGASAGFTYWLNRSLALIGLASHDDVDRLHADGDYAVDTVKLGIRLQN